MQKKPKDNLERELYKTIIYCLKPFQTPWGRGILYGFILGITISCIAFLFTVQDALVPTSIISGSGIIGLAIKSIFRNRDSG